MRKKAAFVSWVICVLTLNGSAQDKNAQGQNLTFSNDAFTVSVTQQYRQIPPTGKSALAFHFEMAKDWHFYASDQSAPGGMNLKIKGSAEKFITFSEPIFPQPSIYLDKFSGKKLGVFSDKFTVFLPFSVEAEPLGTGETVDVDIKLAVEGAVCSEQRCRMTDIDQLSTKVRISGSASMGEAEFALPEQAGATKSQWAAYSLWGALLLAVLAGLSLNIMPCVWPVLPIIVLRIVEQAKQFKGKSTALGLAFCLGILLFFGCLSGANAILQIFYGTVLQWGDQFRSPAFLAAMALLLVVLAEFCFGVFNIALPASVAGKSVSGKGYFGAVGMGFLAAVLSTPCSFAILAAAFAWAQTQPLPLATLAIMTIGLGMALPYAILTSMPALLKHIPKAGRWMELFKQAIGFVLLVIAVKLITALPQARRTDVLYFAVALGFCIWMWGSWVSYNTKPLRKWLVRIIAVLLAAGAGWSFLSRPPEKLIDWQPYDAALVETALTEQKSVLIKFTADWCLSCQAVEKTVYSRRDIAELIREKGVVAIKADTTLKTSPATYDLKTVYNEPGVPVSILLTPGQKTATRWRNLFFADELKKLLEQIPAPK
jgi:thiol:disulfide interchange protein